MKKSIRNSMIVGAVILAIGIAIFVMGMSALNWDFTRLDTANYVERVYEKPDGESIGGVELAVNSFGVTVKSGDKVSLEYYEADDSETSVGIENGVLKISEKRKPESWFTRGIFGFGRFDKKFVLTVPSGLPIDVKSTDAELDMQGIAAAGINADCTNLSLKLSDCEFSDMRLKSTNLTLTAENCRLGDMDLDSTNLSVKATNVEGGSVSVRSTNVSIRASKSSFDAVTAKGTNVDISFDTVTCGNISADGTNSHCRLDGVIVSKIDIDGTNVNAVVKIKGERSEYTVITDGSRVDGTDPEKLLTFDGTNLKTELTFE